MSKKNIEVKVVVKSGRRHNNSHNHGTINQNIARSNPKWEDIGGGMLRHVKRGNIIARQGRVWVSCRRVVPSALPTVPMLPEVTDQAAE